MIDFFSGQYSAFKGYYLTQEWGWQKGDMLPARADVISKTFLGPVSNHIHALNPGLEVGPLPPRHALACVMLPMRGMG